MSSSLTLVFCGTPQFAAPTLRKLVETGFRIPLVVTQPDRPRGRGMGLAASPVKQCALELNLQITQPARIKENSEFRAQLQSIKPDGIIVVGYGRMIPQWMLDLPPLGNLNLHASLLPKYRGAAPVQWAIANGESSSGVTTMKIDAGLDTGDILLQQEVPIAPNDTSETLASQLAHMGADLMIETLRGLQLGSIKPHPQDHAKATLAPILTREDGRINFRRPAQEICNRLRGFQPWPGAFTVFREKNLHIWDAAVVPEKIAAVGELRIESNSVFVGCGGNILELLQLQPEGKKRMSAKDFIHGYHPKTGEKLGTGN